MHLKHIVIITFLTLNVQLGFTQQNYSTPRMAIIVPDSLADCIDTYARWKIKSGYKTDVILLSEIGTSGIVTAADIKSKINALFQKPGSVQYIMLVGDVEQLPSHYTTSLTLNDHYYSTLTGNDYLPDVAIGRLPVSDNFDCNLLISKLTAYQFNPYTGSGWFRKAMVIAGQSNLDDFHGRHMRDKFLASGFTAVDDLRKANGMNTLQQVESGLNDGRSWVFYIGHGTSTAWSDVNPFFSNDRVDSLLPNYSLPVVVSIGCSNADIDMVNGMSFGEKWINAGPGKGAVAFISATESSAFFWSDSLGKYTVINYLDRKALTIGDALNSGKNALYDAIPQAPGGITELTIQQHLLLGDPTLSPFTGQPLKAIVNYPDSVFVDDNYIDFEVTVNGMPIPGALVGLTTSISEIQAGALTDSNGLAHFPVQLQAGDTINVLVSGANLNPTFLSIPVHHSLGRVDNQPSTIKIWPNPAADILWISLSGDLIQGRQMQFSLQDLRGKTVIRQSFKNKADLVVDVSKLPAGFYIFNITENGQIKKTGKLTLQ